MTERVSLNKVRNRISHTACFRQFWPSGAWLPSRQACLPAGRKSQNRE